MKVLWFNNCVLPFFEDVSPHGNNYGCPWGDAMIRKHTEHPQFELIVICPEPVKKYVTARKDGIKYYGYPDTDERLMKKSFLSIIEKENPDIIQLWGTESVNSYYMYETCCEMSMLSRVCVHIQGLVFFYSFHIRASLPSCVIHRGTFKDWIRHTRIIDTERYFYKNGRYEIAILKNVPHILGRTEWDYACSKLINKKGHYHRSRELMREPFFHNQWKYDECEKHSIFVRGGSWCVKGLHYVIEAMKIVLKKYPDTKLYVASGGLEKRYTGSLKDRIKISYYDKYILMMVKKYGLRDKIYFLDSMNDQEMISYYKRANVFVSAATIENLCNCLLEARLIGTPVVASFVGGVTTSVEHGKTGYLYQHDDIFMMAYYIIKIFQEGKSVEELSRNERKWAHEFADRDVVYKELVSVYEEILNG